jgi:peptidase E
MTAADGRRIVAMGGGGFSMEPDNPLLDDYVLSLARSSRPRVCYLPTAGGDDDGYIARFYRGADDGAGLVFAGTELER